MSKIVNARNKYPFISGTTSYIIPDAIIPNVRMLAPIIDDIELVLFESDTISNLPTKDEVAEIRSIAESNCCGFTIHLPTDRMAGSTNADERQGFIDAAKRIIELTAPLSPRGWVLHCEGITFGSSDEDVALWRIHCLQTVHELINAAGDSRLIAIENLAYPFDYNREIINTCNTSYCLDIGHLWIAKDPSWEVICRNTLARTSIIHLHGVKDGKDHISLKEGNRYDLEKFLTIVRECKYSGVITLEVFNENDFVQSMEVIKEIWEN
ncbi:MAG: sugar phosphate isomerase/epimerase [Fibrobacter sp.]|nr:sugar phosphate isomerase/epimerase [Fibrobacter sp.]